MTGLPEVRQRRTAGEPEAGTSTSETSGAASGRAAGAGGAAARNAADAVIVGSGSGPNISEELRALLNRDVIKVQQHQN